MGYNLISGIGNVISAVTGGVFDFVRVPDVGDALTLSPASIIAEFLRAEGFVSDPADGTIWPMYVSYLPSTQDVETNATAIYNTPGLKDGRLMEGEVIIHPGIQIKVRCRSHNTGWAKAEELAKSLDGILNEDITINLIEFRVFSIKRTSDIITLGTEKGTIKNQEFTVNFLVTLKKIIS